MFSFTLMLFQAEAKSNVRDQIQVHLLSFRYYESSISLNQLVIESIALLGNWQAHKHSTVYCSQSYLNWVTLHCETILRRYGTIINISWLFFLEPSNTILNPWKLRYNFFWRLRVEISLQRAILQLSEHRTSLDDATLETSKKFDILFIFSFIN
jgi:hypothetical protein